ncbi:uncharacterized protein LOC101888624 [Musca domestica]|uniref:Uncharacterized protein LOC101888624 n=1 Tax=Musca domestica TaxID=7370 RepID=A0A1I8N2E1_MUSDO|nr:uncharacterized protein LOC101888624 [Musca domestica]
MKFLIVTLVIVAAVLAGSEVRANEFECYQCVGTECQSSETTKLVNCYDNPGNNAPAPATTTAPETRAADATYACFTMRYEDGTTTTKYQKGCITKVNGIATCDGVSPPGATKLDSCVTCQEPKCNSVAGLGVSLLTLAAALYVQYFM